MAYLFAYVPATSTGCTVMAEPEYGDEFPDGYGGFGAPHCACGELTINCDGLCEPVATTAPCTCDDVVCGQLKHIPACSVRVCRHGVALLDYCGGCDLESGDAPCCAACDDPNWTTAGYPLF